MQKNLCKSLLVGIVALAQSVGAWAATYIEQDTIARNKQDYAYLVAYTEANYAAFPAIIQIGRAHV